MKGQTMKKTILAAAFIAFLGSAGVSWGADYQKGVAAAASGDYATALREFKPLAKQGYADAQFNLGVMYDNGYGVPQNYNTAVKWYQLAAKQGYADAQFNLGLMYDKGQGVPQDYKTAVKWIRLAAKQGYARAQFNLGVMYDSGRGVIQDVVYSHMWANLAAANGIKESGAFSDAIAKKMTPAQIAEAQKLARECERKKYKGC
jgi:TPR repeat protein